MNLIDSIQDQPYSTSPSWFKNWEEIGLIAWKDKNMDGKIQYSAGNALEDIKPKYTNDRGDSGERVVENNPNLSNGNEIYIDRDIIVLANPEIAQLPVGNSTCSCRRTCCCPFNSRRPIISNSFNFS